MIRTTTKHRIALAASAALALAAPALAAPDPSGFIHGTVETDSGTSYTGLIRWDNEEFFWDDLFNSSKTELPYLERHGEPHEERSRIRIFGITIGYSSDSVSSGRVFVTPFGNIRELRPRRGDEVEVTMRSGTVHRVEGGSNDIGATIVVHDAALGSVEIDWDSVRRIRFSPAPEGVTPPARRLQGRVITDAGTYEGFIQWDLQECIGTDKLDGDTRDGDLSIEMRHIQAIEKHDRDGSWVELRDGRRLLLEDSNDVDSDLRGIFVETDAHGRVEIPWEAFRRAEFVESDRSGRGYESYAAAGELRGTVTDTSGRTSRGTLVYDLDEAEGWELLNGSLDGIEYNIPFSRIRSIEPRGSDAAQVTLTDGRVLVLEDGQDVSSKNDGVVVLDAEGETHLDWGRIRTIELR